MTGCADASSELLVVLGYGGRRRSGEGIAYSAIGVAEWAKQVPTAEQVRPASCSVCGRESRALGELVTLVSHGLRSRQIRGPVSPAGQPETRLLRVRRYRCLRCGGLTTVLPRGLLARRHYSASAIGLALCLYGLQRLSLGETRWRICTWAIGFEPGRWTTLPAWVAAIEQGRLFPALRPLAVGASLSCKSERAAAALCAMALTGGGPEAQAFEGAALA